MPRNVATGVRGRANRDTMRSAQCRYNFSNMDNHLRCTNSNIAHPELRAKKKKRKKGQKEEERPSMHDETCLNKVRYKHAVVSEQSNGMWVEVSASITATRATVDELEATGDSGWPKGLLGVWGSIEVHVEH